GQAPAHHSPGTLQQRPASSPGSFFLTPLDPHVTSGPTFPSQHIRGGEDEPGIGRAGRTQGGGAGAPRRADGARAAPLGVDGHSAAVDANAERSPALRSRRSRAAAADPVAAATGSVAGGDPVLPGSAGAFAAGSVATSRGA